MSFWADRRAAVAKEAEAHETALEELEAARADAELAERSDEEVLEELGLPEPEALDSPEAVRDFLTKALPQRLKTRALRRLWRLNPVLANLDGLVDYGEDFTDSATVVENLQTAYQVGKGMLKHVEELAAQAEAKANPEPELEPEVEDDAPEDLALMAEDDAPEQVVLAEPAAPADPPAEIEVEAMPASQRRMRFQFEGQKA